MLAPCPDRQKARLVKVPSRMSVGSYQAAAKEILENGLAAKLQHSIRTSICSSAGDGPHENVHQPLWASQHLEDARCARCVSSARRNLMPAPAARGSLRKQSSGSGMGSSKVQCGAWSRASACTRPRHLSPAVSLGVVATQTNGEGCRHLPRAE